MWFLDHAWLIPVVPAIGFFLILFVGKLWLPANRDPLVASAIGVASMAASLVLSAGAAIQWISHVSDAHGGYVEPIIHRYTWWQSGGLRFTIGSHVDGLSIMVLLLVAFISTLVQIYSIEYLRGDRRYVHFFAAMTLFSAGMLAMVVAEGMIQFLLGWEIMGLCSFMLIGHWWEDGANSRAALKAFFTVRVGDVGLLIGISILYFSSHDWIAKNLGRDGFSIQGISAWAVSGEASHTALLMASISLMWAIIGKSGQFPLHTWLPDAMAGPTPVSSLLHSSTMVVAGVFLGARLYPVFYQGFHIALGPLNPMALIGGITIVIAAVLAFVQVDIKKVLAYSTVSQLGYMVMGLGVGAWTPAVFHIFTHAFFKCCLFLGAGSVAHSGSHHSFDMKKDMGGLKKYMPVTFWTFVISTAALAGVPFFSGFFSKDEIIDSAGHNGYTAFMIVGLVGAFMTTAYMVRCIYLTFLGEPRGAAAGIHHDEHHTADAVAHPAEHGAIAVDDEGAGLEAGQAHAVAQGTAHDDHHGAEAGPHESPWLIKAPLIILATLAIAAGYLNAAPFKIEKFTEWVAPSTQVVTLSTATASGIAPESLGVTTVEPAASEGAEIAAGQGRFFPETKEPAPFEWIKAIPSILLVAAGAAVSYIVCLRLYSKRDRKLVGLTVRSRPLRTGYAFLWNKYFLDDLYEKGIVHGVAYPVARAANWINQKVIDAVVNGAGKAAVLVGRFTYRTVDQKIVDGAVNGAGSTARGSGGVLRGLQSGKLQQYGALLFGAAAFAALTLVIYVQAK